MRVAASLVGLVIVVAITWFVIKAQYSNGPEGMKPPAEVIDVVGVKSDQPSLLRSTSRKSSWIGTSRPHREQGYTGRRLPDSSRQNGGVIRRLA